MWDVKHWSVYLVTVEQGRSPGSVWLPNIILNRTLRVSLVGVSELYVKSDVVFHTDIHNP